MQQGRLAAVPLAAAAAATGGVASSAEAQMTVDYSAVNSYSNSGFFTGVFLDQTAASGAATSASSASLNGAYSTTDSLFWRFDDVQDKTVPRSDTTGIVFFWGGQLSGSPAPADATLQATANFTVTYTHTIANPYDDPNLSFELLIGYSSTPYTINPSYVENPHWTATNYTQQYGSFYGAEAGSPLSFVDGVSLNVYEGDTPAYWFAQLSVNWNHEYANSWSWDDNYSKLNGDLFNATGSLAVSYSAPSAVPEPASAGIWLGAFAGIAFALRRRPYRSA